MQSGRSCRSPSLTDVSVVGMMMPERLRNAIRRRFSPNLSIKYGSNEAQYLTAADAAMRDLKARGGARIEIAPF